VGNTYFVKGEIVLPTTGLPAKPVDVIVSVEDTSRADAPAVVVAQQRQRNVSLREGSPVPFRVEVPADRIDERHSYSASAHIDVSGSGDVKVGDLVSTESYPVLTRGYGTEVRIRVKRV
jgi:uncharacterized lipoprotein YbaY